MESKNGWTLSYDLAVSSKFKGSFVEAVQTGFVVLHFVKKNYHFSWKKVNGYVNGFLAGRIWMNTQGDTEILNHETNEICQIKYYPPPSFFSKETPNKVHGLIRDQNSLVKYAIEGTSSEKCSLIVLEDAQNIDIDDIKNLNLTPSKELWKRDILEE